MQIYTFDMLVDHLLSLGIDHGDNICVHSKLLSFGVIEGGCQTVINALRSVVGHNGIIAIPAFTFNNHPDNVFFNNTPPDRTIGALSTFILNTNLWKRTVSPIHSYFIIGDSLNKLNTGEKIYDSFGINSIYPQMEEFNFKLLLLGASFNEGATYIHHCEVEANVPYRFPIEIKFVHESDEKNISLISLYHARKDKNISNDFSKFEKYFKNKYSYMFSKIPYGCSSCIPLKLLRDEVLKLINYDNEILLV